MLFFGDHNGLYKLKIYLTTYHSYF
jgi:hypothetical protein